jgi:CheY-like chemotaxis protein/HPt (histidine-containing phosphotransfer) domain-containing protein
MNIDAAPFMLEDVFNKLSAMVSPAAEAKGLEILFAVDPAVPQYLKGDSMRLSQILTNITTNAIKFTEHGEILINCAVLPPEDAEAGAGGGAAPALSGKPGGDKLGLQFVVHDTGIGMSKEQLAGLFTPFKQVDGSITRKYGGTGLGLALTKKLVQMMGGEIYISSAENEGTDVSFTIFVETAVKARSIKNIPSLEGMRVLLVDDNETARQVISGMLSGLKLEAHAVASARTAYAELVEAEQKRRPYKLLLLDWRMPEITGLEAAKHVKNNLGLRECPVMLLVTAFGKSEITFSQQECGLSGIIYKPVSPSQLLNAVQDALEGEKSAGGAGAWPVSSSSERLTGCKVLLVEDNLLHQEVVKEILAEAGMEAVTAETGQAAVELLLEGGNKFDAVLMDVQMPGMDGFTACKKIREEANLKELPIIALTAQGADGGGEKFSAAGMNDYIVKPVDIDTLLHALGRWIPARDVSAGPDLRLAGSALPDLPGFNAKNALERLGGNARLYYTLAQQFCARHSNADKLMDSAISYGNAQEAALEARAIKGLSATLGAESLSLKAARIEDCLSRNKNLDDEFYWLFDGFCIEFSFVVNMLGQALQLSGLKIVVEDAYNMSKCLNFPHAADGGGAQALLPEQEQQALKARLAERTPGKPAEQGVKMGVPAEEPLSGQPGFGGTGGEKTGLSGEAVDILVTLKLKMEDDDASALTHLQGTLEVLAKEMPAAQLQKLAQAVEIFDYSAGLETVRNLLADMA